MCTEEKGKMIYIKKSVFLGIIFLSIYSLFFLGAMGLRGSGKINNNSYKIEIKNGWFYVNGERFFVKGVNYCGWRPGRSPHDLDNVDLKLAENDFRLIKEAGFNTIRTAGGLNPELMELAKKYGLMVMYGIWFDRDINYSDPEKIKYATDMVKKNVEWAKDFDNILCYLVMNEPVMERVREAGKADTEDFLKNIKNAVKSIDPNRNVSFANWVPLSFIDHSFWDAICFNVYNYAPVTITYSLGYKGYIEWLKDTIAKDKPLIITEYGLSVSERRIGEGNSENFGYGGNSLDAQKTGVIKMYDDIIQAGAQGGCVFEWIDTWWMQGDKREHDNHPEEWFGVLGIDTMTSDPKGTLRPVYQALKEYNQAIVVEPKKLNYYSGEVPIEIYSTDKINLIQYRINENHWQYLKKQGDFWWKAKWNSEKWEDGRQVLEIKTLGQDNNLLCSKKIEFWTANKNSMPPLPYQVEIITDREGYRIKEKMQIKIKVVDAKGRPIGNQAVYYSFFQPIGWDEFKYQSTTNEKGEIDTQYSTFTPGYITVAAGVLYKDGDYERNFGNVKAVLFKLSQ